MNDGFVEHKYGLVRIAIYDEIEHPNIFYPDDAFATALLAVKNGLVVNYVGCIIYDDQIDDDGNPILSKIRIPPYVNLDIHAHVTACLLELKNMGVLSNGLQVQNLYLGGFKRAISVGKWCKDAPENIEFDVKEVLKDDYTIPIAEDFIGFLLTQITKIEDQGEFYSHQWYLLKICLLYFFSKELTANDIFNIGFLGAQMESKFIMEEDAIKAKVAESYRKKGALIRSQTAPQKRQKQEQAIIALFEIAKERFGVEAVRQDLNAAACMHEIALVERPKELIKASTGEIITIHTIRNKLKPLRKAGKIE